jgi:asparagine synthase (glutamine-hydrolysing)
MSMANSVEIRVPFLDRRIMEFSGNCDLRLLVPGKGPSKPVLRAALRKKGASADVWSAPKRGFNNPLAELIRGPLRALCTRVFEDSPGIFEPYLRPDAVRGIWRSHAGRKCNHAYALWAILTFAIWRSQLEGNPITPPQGGAG